MIVIMAIPTVSMAVLMAVVLVSAIHFFLLDGGEESPRCMRQGFEIPRQLS